MLGRGAAVADSATTADGGREQGAPTMRKTIQKAKIGVVTRLDGVANTSASIALDAAGVVTGIAFHLIDEGLAEVVCPESARRTVRRIGGDGTTPMEVSRSLWGEMSNAERLAYLLASSDTEFHVDDAGVARLAVRGAR